jgi:hypothetical protein
VPWVQFTTAALVAGASTYSVGLAQGPAPGAGGADSGPAPSTAAGAIGGSGPGSYGGSVGTTFKPTGFSPSTTSAFAPAQQTTNAGVRANPGAVLGLMAGGVMAVLAL